MTSPVQDANRSNERAEVAHSSGRATLVAGTVQTQCLAGLDRHTRLVERENMEMLDAIFGEIPNLLANHLRGDLKMIGTIGPFEPIGQRLRYAGPAPGSKRGHFLKIQDRQNAGHDGCGDAPFLRQIQEPIVVVVVEKELRDRAVCSGTAFVRKHV